MKSRRVAIGLLQTAPSRDADQNLSRALALTRRAAAKGARIVCLPELFRSPYFPQARRAAAAALAETIPGPSTEAFSRLAKELGIVVVVPVFERAASAFYNSAAVVDADGRLLGAYRKVHIPHDPLFWEKSYFAPGDRGFKVFPTRFAKIAPLICYDQWYPEAARACALAGAELVFYPTAIGFIEGEKTPEGDWRDSWVTVQRSHSIANGVHVAAVNRVGREGRLRFFGTSFVCDAFGGIVKKAGSSREEVLVATVDLSLNRFVQEGWGFLRNRRPDAYRRLARR